MNKLAEACNRNNCILIEDCAQSLWNPNWNKNPQVPGSYGDFALFSTGFFKAINSVSGGYLLFNKKNDLFFNLINDHKNLKNKFSYDFIFRFFYGIFFLY